MKIASFRWFTLLILVEKIPPLDVLIVSEFIGAHPEFGIITVSYTHLTLPTKA